jgi:hypothetical protein
MAAYVGRLQALAARTAEVARSQYAPRVVHAYDELMKRNAGAAPGVRRVSGSRC